MHEGADPALHHATASWCTRASGMVGDGAGGFTALLALTREGIGLRRRWDRADREAPLRRELLRLLPALQSLAQQRLAEGIESGEAAAGRWVDLVVEQIRDDDQYLVGLLSDYFHAPEPAAFAIECFRDDLHWLSTQVAVLDGSRGIDFLGRVLLEQETLEHQIESWDSAGHAVSASEQAGAPTSPGASPKPGGVGGEPTRSPAEAADVSAAGHLSRLRAAARRLRAVALARQVTTLLDRPDPEDGEGWYRTWQAASRLAARLDSDLPAAGDDEDSLPGDGPARVEALRRVAGDRWRGALEGLEPEQRDGALAHAADDLGNTARETLTFLDDLSLSDSVRSLEILDDDLRRVREAADERGPVRRSLQRDRRAVAAELQERRIAWRMEQLFGHGFVAALERTILVLLLLFVGMLLLEGPLIERENARMAAAGQTGHGPAATVFAWADLGICLVFLFDFCLKLALAKRRGLYLWRNWLTGLVPAIPFGFLGYAVSWLAAASEVEGLTLLRFLRYLRLPRMARWLRIARPVLRAMRVVGFLLRASDRLVRQLAPLVNRNLVFFERGGVIGAEPPYRAGLVALRERFDYRAAETVAWLPVGVRQAFVRTRIDDMLAMLSSPRAGGVVPGSSVSGAAVRDFPVEEIINRLLSATPAGISDRIGSNLVQSVTRWCRALDVFGVRRLPVVRDLVAASRLPSPYDTTAQVANRIGHLLGQSLDRLYWVADLYGTVTSPQLVDSVGEYLVKATARPAKRLLLFGVGFLAVSQLALLIDVAWLDTLARLLRRLVGLPLIVLGGACALPLMLGIWFRQIAGEATDFFRQVAEAQFITATKRIKRNMARSQRAVFDARVLAPEAALDADAVHPARAAAAQLWDEYLDGPPFHSTDTGTTNHLLGNLALVSLRETRLRYTRRERKRLRRLDLGNTRASLRGPYLWFRFISRSLAHHTAKLVENYNAFALPLVRAPTAEDDEILAYAEWLEKRLGKPVAEIELPAPFRRRLDRLGGPAGRRGARPRPSHCYQGNDFTSIHFLSDDAEVDRDVRRRYGDVVADLMRRDRHDNFRRVFRTYPFHRRLRDRRTLNPLSLYERHMAGGRVLLVPFKLLGLGLAWAARVVGVLGSVVREVRNPGVRELSPIDDPDPFEVARRKIHRMRKPVFMECLRMRARFDPEYLGIVPPGATAGVRESSVVQVEDDLEQIGAVPSVRRRFRDMASQRRRQMLEFRDWLQRRGGTYSSEALRAMAIAYTVDHRGARSRLEDVGLLERAFHETLAAQARSQQVLPRGSAASAWCRLWNRRRLNRLFDQPSFAHLDRRQRAACRRCVCRRRGPLPAALRRLTPRGPGGADPAGDAWKALAAVGRDPATWTRQLVILRAVQTLTVLDLDTYTRLVHELGEYDPRTRPKSPGGLPTAQGAS